MNTVNLMAEIIFQSFRFVCNDIASCDGPKGYTLRVGVTNIDWSRLRDQDHLKDLLSLIDKYQNWPECVVWEVQQPMYALHDHTLTGDRRAANVASDVDYALSLALANMWVRHIYPVLIERKKADENLRGDTGLQRTE